VKARRSRLLLVLVVVAMNVATSAAVASKPGWEVKRTVSQGPYTAIDTARRCGASEFGTYTIGLAYTFTAGPLTGKTVRVMVTLALRDDHRRHAFRFVSVAGTAIDDMSPADRQSVESALSSSFSQYSIEVLHVLQGWRLRTRMWAKGKVLATGNLWLQRTHC
jgi:hypothetical protein